MTFQPIDLPSFGIPSLDRLLSPDSPDARVIAPRIPKSATSICIIGSDGTGKSVLALHLASRYMADAVVDSGRARPRTRCIYLSTDLARSKADEIWKGFALDRPNSRKNPLDDVRYEGRRNLSIPLEAFEPGREEEASKLAHHLVDPSASAGVAFLDTTRGSTGDEWGLLTQLVANLRNPGTDPKHMVLIDAVEGLETMVGERDAHGEERSRRSRIAQLMRIAGTRCHVVFVVEESKTGERLPEEFVSDVVIALREVDVNGYSRRTIAVEKVRGQSHARGQHAFTLRSGHGSFTTKGKPDGFRNVRTFIENADDPEVKDDTSKRQGYVKVYPSLHRRSREAMRSLDQHRSASDEGLAQFGIEYLDNMLVQRKSETARGLPPGTITALIGEPGTHKVHVSRSFLAGTFSALRQEVERSAREKRVNWSERERLASEAGASVLVTTEDVDAPGLATQFARWFLKPGLRNQNAPSEETVRRLRNLMLPHIVCRRLEIHDLPSSILLDIVLKAVECAIPRARVRHPGAEDRVRLVLEDLKSWKEIYPNIRKGSLLLPSLAFFLRRTGVTTLIVDSHPTRPGVERRELADDELRSLANHWLYTWRVPFFGESRVAIAAIPPLSADVGVAGSRRAARSVVRELTCSPPGNGIEPPGVDPHFELYKGLEEGSPKPVPLEVRLLGETPQVLRYIEQENRFLEGVFTPVTSSPGVIRSIPPVEYKTLRDWCRGQPETLLDHTLLIQVDEFWLVGGQEVLQPQQSYLEAFTWRNGQGVAFVDPHGVFRAENGQTGDLQRRDFFLKEDNTGHCLPAKGSRDVDRVPFTWDFGFLLCRLGAWESFRDRTLPFWGKPAHPVSVGAVWDSLPKARGYADSSGGADRPSAAGQKPRPTWRQFLGACQVIADASAEGGSRRFIPFDVDLGAPESFSCFVLEVWASEYCQSFGGGAEVKECTKRLSTREWSQPQPGHFLLDDKHPHRSEWEWALFRTWWLLVDILDLSGFGSPDRPFDPLARESSPSAVAARHWYKSACAAQQAARSEVTVAAGLPGMFSTRGDWFLGVARQSRSPRLADRAMDFFSSRRANFERMQLGMGLPTRDIEGQDAERIRTFLKGPPIGTEDDPRRIRPECMTNVSYGDLRLIGAPQGDTGETGFWWLWRSTFRDYDQLNAVWQKSLVRMAISWSEYRREQGPKWVPGLHAYDFLEQNQVKSFDALEALETTSAPEEQGLVRQLKDAGGRLRSNCDMVKRLLLQAANPRS